MKTFTEEQLKKLKESEETGGTTMKTRQTKDMIT